MSKYKGVKCNEKKLVALLAMMTMLIGCGCSIRPTTKIKTMRIIRLWTARMIKNDTMDNSIGNDADRVGTT